MKIFDKNIESLKKYHPYILPYFENLKDSKDRVFFKNNLLKIDNLTCYSKYNPEKEAESLINKWSSQNSNIKNVVIFGVSNPFVIKKLSEKFIIFLFVPDIGIFRQILNYVDFSGVFSKIKKIVFRRNEIPVNNFHIFPLKVESKIFSHQLAEITTDYKKEYIKVLLVNPIYGGSLPISHYIAENLKKYNVKLTVINCEKFYEAMNYIKGNFSSKRNEAKAMESFLKFISDIILFVIEEFKPDVIFGVAQSPIGFDVLKYCSEKGITKIFWFMEDYKLFTYWKQFAPYYDYYFTIQKDEFFEELKKINVKNFYYLPVAAEPTVHKPLELTEDEKRHYGSTLSFVGAGYYNRRIFFRNLIDYDFKIWGSDWEGEVILKDKIQKHGRRVTPEEYVKIFNASLININLHSSTYLPGVDPDGDFVNPRTFEIAATNSIQVVDRRKYLPELFNEGEEIVVFSNFNEFKRLIDDIINNPEKYRKIAKNAYNRVLKEHTYEHRLKEMFNFIGFKLEKIEFAEGSADFYFFKFNSIEEMVSYINKKEKINEDEKIILLMNALKETYLK